MPLMNTCMILYKFYMQLLFKKVHLYKFCYLTRLHHSVFHLMKVQLLVPQLTALHKHQAPNIFYDRHSFNTVRPSTDCLIHK